jgi:hypothetical protein
MQQKAIVYFHGMGDQERFGELSKLTNVLVDYLQLDPTELTVHNEQFFDGDGEIGYFQLKTTGKNQSPIELRLYEVYWGPITAGKSNALDVLRWMLPQFMNAWKFLTTLGDWHGQPRMRRVSLHRMFHDGGSKPDSVPVFNSVLEEYESFLDDTQSSQDFVGWLKRRRPKNDILALARKWKNTLFWRTWQDFIALLFLAALVVNVLASMVILLSKSVAMIGELTKASEKIGPVKLDGVFLLEFLNWVQGILGNAWLFQQFDALMGAIKPHPVALMIPVLVGAVCWYGLWFIQQFLANFMGDVQLWTTYKENNTNRATRDEILHLSERVFEHVLHGNSQEVTVVAHSLGSTVAHDALYRLGYKLEAAPKKSQLKQRLVKFKHFITAGSPIDKVFFFFESQRFNFRELEQMMQTQRGDVSKAPLAHMHWTNFFDKGDPISGTVFSANAANSVANTNPDGSTNASVQNVEVSNTQYPGPASHGGYFTHTEMLRCVASAVQEYFYTPPKNKETSRFAVPVFRGLLVLPFLVFGTAVSPAFLGLIGLEEYDASIKGFFAQVMSADFVLILTGLIVSLVYPSQAKPPVFKQSKYLKLLSVLGFVFTVVALIGVIGTSVVAPEQNGLYFSKDNGAFQDILFTNREVLGRAVSWDNVYLMAYGLLLVVLGVRNWSSAPGKITVFLGVIAAALDSVENVALLGFVEDIVGVSLDKFIMFQILVTAKFVIAALAVMAAAVTFKYWRPLQIGFVVSSAVLLFGAVMAGLFPSVYIPVSTWLSWNNVALAGLGATGACMIAAIGYFGWELSKP